MQDNFRDHINNAREDFEVYPFDSDKEWSQVSKRISSGQKIHPWQVASIAACFVAIICGALFFMNSPENDNSELAEMERFYDGEINQKITLIKGQVKDDKVLLDIQEMNSAFSELKNDLKDNVDNEEVVAAMMENYRLKLQILEEILKELEKENSEEVL